MAMSAFGVEDSRISKADEDRRGDRPGIKYALSGLAGHTVGAQTGARIGARTAGRRYGDIAEDAQAAMQEHLARETPETLNGSNPLKAGFMAGRKAAHAPRTAVVGYNAARKGGIVGGIGGAAAGMGSYALYRHRKNA